MILERIYTDGLAQVAYLVGDRDDGAAVLIDPRRDVGEYLEIAARHGVRIIAAVETHVHADFVSGALELADRTGAAVYAPRLGDSEFPHHPLDDGDEIRIGEVLLQALHTPGHTPEHLSYLLYEQSEGSDPVGIFTGDALFVGEVGRPDLLGDEATEGLIQQLYDTVFNRLSPLSDDLIVYPGHGAGSSCGRNIGSEPTTTIGQERLGNYAFKPRGLEPFKNAVMADMPPAPTYYPILKNVNQVGPALIRTLPSGEAVQCDIIQRALNDGAVVIDARRPMDFAATHIPGSVSIGAGSSFAAWVGWLAPHDHPVYLVMESDEQYSALLTELRRIGVDNVAGYLAGGIDAWQRDGRPVGSFPVISVDQLNEQLQNSDDIQVVDVRSSEEWRSGHIAGAHHRFIGSLIKDETGLPDAPTIAFVCGGGYRSNVAASVARLRGYRSVVNIGGGMNAWMNAGYPTVRD